MIIQVNISPMGKARPRLGGKSGGKRRAFLPESYRRWKEHACLMLRPFVPRSPIIGPVSVWTYFWTKTGNCQSDLDNAHAAILDVLQDAGIILNDKQVKQGSYGINKSKPGAPSDIVTITIEPIKE